MKDVFTIDLAGVAGKYKFYMKPADEQLREEFAYAFSTNEEGSPEQTEVLLKMMGAEVDQSSAGTTDIILKARGTDLDFIAKHTRWDSVLELVRCDVAVALTQHIKREYDSHDFYLIESGFLVHESLDGMYFYDKLPNRRLYFFAAVIENLAGERSTFIHLDQQMYGNNLWCFEGDNTHGVCAQLMVALLTNFRDAAEEMNSEESLEAFDIEDGECLTSTC